MKVGEAVKESPALPHLPRSEIILPLTSHCCIIFFSPPSNAATMKRFSSRNNPLPPSPPHWGKTSRAACVSPHTQTHKHYLPEHGDKLNLQCSEWESFSTLIILALEAVIFTLINVLVCLCSRRGQVRVWGRGGGRCLQRGGSCGWRTPGGSEASRCYWNSHDQRCDW